MPDFIENMLDDVPLDMKTGVAATPAAEHLFNINPNGTPLPPEQAEQFHTLVAKMLYLCKRNPIYTLPSLSSAPESTNLIRMTTKS
jgi:hypothetical protein